MRERKGATKERTTKSVGIDSGVLERLRCFARRGPVRTVISDIVSAAVRDALDREEAKEAEEARKSGKRASA